MDTQYDTHEIASVSIIGDVYSDFYTELDGELVWNAIAAMPFVKRPSKAWAVVRYHDYQDLENRPVLDTMRRVFDGLAALL